MKLVILPQALAELQQAATFYIEHANVELGESFAAEFERAVSALLEHPLSALSGEALRVVFRFAAFHTASSTRSSLTSCGVVAVAHQSRRPGYWAGRRP